MRRSLPSVRRSVAASSLIFALFSGSTLPSALAAGTQEAPTPDNALRQVEDKLGNVEKRYDKLLKDVRSAVEEALEATPWDGSEAGLTLAAHPHVELVTRLHNEAVERCGQRKNPAAVAELVEKYQWHKELELPRGLEFGTDRPIPKNSGGFIELETPDDPLPGYPELHVNYYLWGTGEIAGWQTGVKKGKAKFTGRTKKDVVAPCEELPSHEAIRVYLTGNLPETPLLAIPELQHRIHTELARKRTSEDGERHQMDEFLALFASKWNGFVFRPTYAKKDFVITAPLHGLLTDVTSFPFHFKNSDSMKEVGDLPFTAVQTYMEYSELFRGTSITSGDIIAKNKAGKAALDDFTRDVSYVSRYKALIDILVRSLLSPEIPLPAYLSAYDYPSIKAHAPPAHRTPGASYDVPRRQALLLWAACEGDPVRLAEWLHEHILSTESNVFPSKQSMPLAMVAAVRAQEKELLQAVAGRIAKERESRGDGAGPGPFEREFSPHEDYLSGDGEPNANAIANSFHQFHAELSNAISGAALEAVLGKIQ